jgi:2-polyprenyl-6-methoxyphenol hydroxylase-like FAD-dependent oxidoreductase
MPAAQWEACVVGGGPAGAVAALRLAQLGHRVCLVETLAFPRTHVGESLSRGVWPLFDVLGLRETLVQERFLGHGGSRTRWAEAHAERLPAEVNGGALLVDRGRFDMILLRAAAAAGVHVFQPARARIESREQHGWRVQVDTGREEHRICAEYLVDATGGKTFFPGKRTRVSPPTVAICGHLRLQGDPRATLVEALCDGWCWGAPVSGGSFSAMVFLDPGTVRQEWTGTLEVAWRSYLARAELFAGISGWPLVRPLSAHAATTYYVTDPIGPDFVKVGEASFRLDPLSSTGVEKAMQTGCTAATALHTMISRPERQGLCLRFYRARHQETVAAHATWSSASYRKVERFAERPFWQARAGVPANDLPRPSALWSLPEDAPLELTTRVRVSEQVRFIEEPCVIDDEIQAQEVLVHPSLERPVAFVEGVEIGRLLSMVPWNEELGSLLQAWSSRVSLQEARRIATWLIRSRILEAMP